MISYCICCYRAKYDLMLIDDLINKTSVPYEILLWINTPDRSVLEHANALSAKGFPIKIVGDTPENIGMNAFSRLFLASQYEMIAQLDDDVLRVSPGIPQKCLEIFRRHDEVKYLVADVWQDEYTNGNRPGMDSYKVYSQQHGLYDGPIDSWYGVYHRSILKILLQAPYEKYFFLGSFVRGTLPRFNQIGVLCTKFKVLHACGPLYPHAFGLHQFEVNKFRSVNMPEMADAYAKATLPDKEKILAKFEEAKKHIDSFGTEAGAIPQVISTMTGKEAMEQKMAIQEQEGRWEEVRKLVDSVNPHYGINPGEVLMIFDLIKDCAFGSVIVEIGVCHGRTAALLAYVAKKCRGEYHGIDRFGFDGTTKEGVEKTLRDLGLDPKLHKGESNLSSGQRLACPAWNKPINILFIDGGHDEQNIKGDCEMWLPHVVSGGLVIFDDWNDGEPYTNAHWGVKYYSELHCKGWEVLMTNQKLHVRRKP